MVPKFIFVLLIAGITVVGASLLWGRFTATTRPAPLSTVRNLVVQTPVGGQVAAVLGVSDETALSPIDIASAASALAQGVATRVQQYTRHVVATQAIRELTRQYSQLSVEDQQQIQSAICQ